MNKLSSNVIFTKYIPASLTKPTRIKVYKGNDFKGIIISKGKLENEIDGLSEKDRLNFPGESTDEKIHTLAAMQLCEKLGWKGELIIGGYRDGFVFLFK